MAQPGVDAADPAPVLTTAIDAGPVGWSPDGDRLLLQVEDQIWIQETASGDLSMAPGNPYYHVAWAREGVLYYLAGEGMRLLGVRLQ